MMAVEGTNTKLHPMACRDISGVKPSVPPARAAITKRPVSTINPLKPNDP